MADAFVSFVLEKLRNKLRNLFKRRAKFSFSQVSNQVRLAQLEQKLIHAFLKEAHGKYRQDGRRIWVPALRDAADDLEDACENFVLKVSSKRIGSEGSSFDEGVHLGQIGSEIEGIMTRLSDLRSRMDRYNIVGIRESGGEASLADERRTYSHTVERHVVGLEDSREELVMHLVNDDGDRHRVVSIWGMGGSGKTTLARQVYHHHHVRRHFTSRAWVCLSPQFRVRDVWQQILVGLVSADREEIGEIAEMRDDELARRLYRVQQDERCLVVLDDIWSIGAWKSLEAAFPCVETRSRVLLTTRREGVALHASRNGFRHQPLPLSQNESWELFERTTNFGRNDADFDVYTKKELGEKMLRLCAGLPLAITVLGNPLAYTENRVDDWHRVYNDFYDNIRGDNHGQVVLQSLALSYDELPYHLKLCFLYLGCFPEDFEIPVKRLTQLWIADGLITFAQKTQGVMETMEDVAYNCLNDLVERCMVQVGQHGSIRKIKTCRIHSLMRDLCLLKAREDGFLQIANFSDKSTVIGSVRRLAIYLEEQVDEFFPPRDERDGRLRSLLYFGSKEWMQKSGNVLDSRLKDFKVLRVLKLEEMREDVKLPSEIGSMIHLRFLSLRKSRIAFLPSSIGGLTCMQTLDFGFEWSSLATDKIVPNVLWKMEQLRHLYLPRYYRSGSIGSIQSSSSLKLSRLHNLQTLSGLLSDNCDLCDLEEVANLRKLAIQLKEPPLENLEIFLRFSSSIRSLYIQNNSGLQKSEEVIQIVMNCRNIYKLKLFGLIKELPTELESYPNLTKLSLCDSGLTDNQTKLLEKLPNLTTLCLEKQAFEENTNTLVCSSGGFLRLEVLDLKSLKDIREWRVEEGAMSSLCRLHITHCSRLKTIPDGLRYITTLRELTISGMSPAFCRRLEEGGENFYKIQHVPSRIFREMWQPEE